MKLLKFYATWCGPCKSLSQVIDSMKDDIKIPVAEIDIDDNRETAITYGIRSVPTMILVDENDTQIKRHSGVMNKDQLKQFLEI